MGRSWVLVVLVGLAGCKALYGDPPQRLRTPEPIKPPDDPVVVEQVEYREDCAFYTSRTAGKVKRDPIRADVHTLEADKKIKDYDVAVANAKADLIIDGIDEYAAALQKDPFNARATLRLALAYDKVRRKGCALALLRRLDQLAQNAKFSREANDAIDEILQTGNRRWFEGYRREALRVVGRPGADR